MMRLYPVLWLWAIVGLWATAALATELTPECGLVRSGDCTLGMTVNGTSRDPLEQWLMGPTAWLSAPDPDPPFETVREPLSSEVPPTATALLYETTALVGNEIGQCVAACPEWERNTGGVQERERLAGDAEDSVQLRVEESGEASDPPAQPYLFALGSVAVIAAILFGLTRIRWINPRARGKGRRHRSRSRSVGASRRN